MSPIAEAQRKSGRAVGRDAEIAWNEASAMMQEMFAAAPGAQEAEALGDPPWVAEATPGSLTHREHTTPLAERRTSATAADDQLTLLVRRLFAEPPLGAGAKRVMFCSAGLAEPLELVQSLAHHVAAHHPSARMAVVLLHAGGEPATLGADSAVQVLAMTAAQARRGVTELNVLFDFVLFDARLTGADPDVLALARSIDGVALVVAENATRREAAKALVATLQQSGARLLGAVLSNRTYPIPRIFYDRL
jgi:hypothetical protein